MTVRPATGVLPSPRVPVILIRPPWYGASLETCIDAAVAARDTVIFREDDVAGA